MKLSKLEQNLDTMFHIFIYVKRLTAMTHSEK